MPHDAGSELSSDLSHLETVEIEPVSLRFRDRRLEAAYRRQFFRDNLGNIRFAFLGGAVLWVIWGLVIYPYMLAVLDKRVDLILRYSVFIPLLLVGFGFSFTRWFERTWEWVTTSIVIVTILVWVYYISLVLTMPTEYGYVGLILITAFTYTLIRLRFLLVMLITVVGIAAYLPYAVDAVYILGVTTVLATLFLVTFGVLGGVVAYRTERASRVLFLRERQLQFEHERSEGLLLNILPRAIVDRLKREPDGRVADALDEVSVVFADAVDSTEHAAITTPELFAETLDRLFRRFDDIADRHGLEKIKTIGDAYMGVAGAPVPVPDHAARTAEAALEMVEAAGKVRWPSGDAIRVRVGMASGPAVAGVIGQRKFAYDLWGDTVNIAARLEENGETGRILLTERMAQALSDRYEFGPLLSLDLKGKGPTPVRFLLGRIGKVSAPAAAPVTTADAE
jgi:class 3 adenylate cyclase